jgi:hypothetical protein
LKEGVASSEKCYPIQAASDPRKGRHDAEVDLHLRSDPELP